MKEPLDECERREWKNQLKTQHSINEDHGIWSHYFMTHGWENIGKSDRLFSWAKKITADGDCSYEIKIHLLFGRKAISNLDSILESRDITLSTGPSRQSYGFSSSHVQMQVLNHKESWASNNWSFWTLVLEKTLESPLGCREIKPVNPEYTLERLMLKLKCQ